MRSLASTQPCTATRCRWAESPSQEASWFSTSCGVGCDGAANGWTKLACTSWGSPGAYKRGRRAIRVKGVRGRKNVKGDQLYINSAITVEGSSHKSGTLAGRACPPRSCRLTSGVEEP